jgi:hypothetical protein
MLVMNNPVIPNVHPYVQNAAIVNNLIEITVVFDYAETDSYAEISGSATQSSGAFANFYDIKKVTPAPTGADDDHPTASVSAHPLPPNNFVAGEDVTFVIKVAKVWLSILGPDQKIDPNISGQDPRWNVVKQVSVVSDGDDNAGSSGGGAGSQTAAAGR